MNAVMKRRCGEIAGYGWGGVPLSRPSPAAYIWLAYSIFFFFEPIFRHSPRYWVECLAIYAVFLLMYVGLDVIEVPAVKLGVLIGFTAIGVAAFPFNHGASTFFLYSACMVPFTVEEVRVVALLAGLDFCLLVGEGFLLKQEFLNYAIPAFFLLVGAVSNTWMARQRAFNKKLAMAQEEIEQLAAVAERERIARDLHDVLGHTLSVIVLKAELAGRLLNRDPERAASELAEVEQTARTALAEVREAIGGYRSKGLEAELAQARRTLAAAGVSLLCELDPELKSNLPAAEETVFTLALREAITNIVRHAEATECRLIFRLTNDGYYALRIEDNGTKKVAREGNGLRGMRERVQSLQGRFRLTSRDGTALLIELPLAADSARELDTQAGIPETGVEKPEFSARHLSGPLLTAGNRS